MQKANRLVDAYVGELDLHPVYVLGTCAEQPVKIGTCKDIAALVRRLSRGAEADVAVKSVWWCGRPEAAMMIVESCRETLRSVRSRLVGQWAAITAVEADALIEQTADEFGVALDTDESIRARAEATIQAVESQLETMKRTGGLKSVNRAYREYRLGAAAKGEGALPYPRWFDNYKVGLVRAAAALSMRPGGEVRSLAG